MFMHRDRLQIVIMFEQMAHITRFQVMAVLQAARARYFGLDSDEAKSWGLNRALFYAAAKKRWADAKAIGARRPVIPEFDLARKTHELEYQLGGEKAFVCRGPRIGLRFRFGARTQLPRDFDHQVKNRFDNWTDAWNEAVEIIKSSDPQDLQSQSRFFNKVYKPRRDELAEKWSALGASASRRPLRPAA
jgi:hypothetical protein